MKVLEPGQLAVLSATVTATVANGVTLTTCVFDVVDEAGNVLQASSPATIDTNTSPFVVSMSIGVPATTLPAGKTRAIRQARMTLTTSDTLSFRGTADYVIRAGEALVIGENSFGTYLEAELIAYESIPMNGWNNAVKSDRIRALIAARQNLCRLQFTYDPYDAQNRLTDFPGGFGMHRPAEWTAADLATLPVAFLEALKKAQVYQADFLLGGSPEESAGMNGLFSKTVGESSEMYRPGMGAPRAPVCKRAMAALQGYTTVKRWHIGRG